MGAIASDRIKNKPLKVILFINKFDLYSKTPPEDSASSAIRKDLLNNFQAHIEIAFSQAKSKSIPFQVIVGSSLEKWNTSNLLQEISDAIYMNK